MVTESLSLSSKRNKTDKAWLSDGNHAFFMDVTFCLFIRVRIENVTDDFGVMVKLH